MANDRGQRKPRLRRLPLKYYWAVEDFLRKDLQQQSKIETKDIDALIRAEDLRGLDETTIKDTSVPFDSVEEFAIRRLLCCFLTKFDKFKASEKEAISKFLENEMHCERVNARLHNLSGRLIDDLRARVQYYLGPVPNVSELLGRHGPGASVGCSRKQRFPLWKIQLPWAVTEAAIPHVTQVVCENEQLSRYFAVARGYENCLFSLVGYNHPEDTFLVEKVEGSRISFVPKNYKSLRTISVEPTGNIYLQLAIGDLLKKRLKRKGLDLTTQALNQKLALRGSVDGSYATIDLSAASDTVSLKLVELLVPPEWFRLLDDLRSQKYVLDKSTECFHKFSSMGNGFTFPLQSIIYRSIVDVAFTFYGFTRLRRDSAVYGDDIVIPTPIAQFTVDLLTFCGFKVNVEKSFVDKSNRFRESCGVEAFKGVNVTPVRLYHEIRGVNQWFGLHNRLFCWYKRFAFNTDALTKFFSKYVTDPLWGPANNIHSDCFFFTEDFRNQEIWKGWIRHFRVLLSLTRKTDYMWPSVYMPWLLAVVLPHGGEREESDPWVLGKACGKAQLREEALYDQLKVVPLPKEADLLF